MRFSEKLMKIGPGEPYIISWRNSKSVKSEARKNQGKSHSLESERVCRFSHWRSIGGRQREELSIYFFHAPAINECDDNSQARCTNLLPTLSILCCDTSVTIVVSDLNGTCYWVTMKALELPKWLASVFGIVSACQRFQLQEPAWDFILKKR